MPDANDKLAEAPPTGGSALTPVECASCKALRQRIAELEEELAMLNTPDQADNIVTRNKALADLAAAKERIEELEVKHNRLRSAAQVVINFASHGGDVPTVYLGRLHEALGGQDD